MKTLKIKLLAAAFLVLAMFAFAPAGMAATGDSDFTNVVATNKVKFQTYLYAEGGYGRSVLTLQSSSTSIEAAQLAYSIILKRVGGAGGLDSEGYGTVLADGTPGQVVTVLVVLLETNGSWVITPTTATGFTKLTLDADGKYATLLFVDATVGWVIRATNCTITTTN